jgi:hypothetical protein
VATVCPSPAFQIDMGKENAFRGNNAPGSSTVVSGPAMCVCLELSYSSVFSPQPIIGSCYYGFSSWIVAVSSYMTTLHYCSTPCGALLLMRRILRDSLWVPLQCHGRLLFHCISRGRRLGQVFGHVKPIYL